MSFALHRGLVALALLMLLVFDASAQLTEPDPLCGDADWSRFVSSSDARLALLASIGLSACQDCRCDVTDDGRITATDARMILGMAVRETVSLSCPDCSNVCGDGVLAPFMGTLFAGPGSNPEIASCEELDHVGPGSPAPFDARVIKALDENFADVTDQAYAYTDNNGCFCHYLASDPNPFAHTPQKSSRQNTTTSTEFVSSTSLDCSDCFFGIYVRSPQPLSVVEVRTDSTGHCGGYNLGIGARTRHADIFAEGEQHYRIDSLVSEECDDGNTISNDGCSADCKLEESSGVNDCSVAVSMDASEAVAALQFDLDYSAVPSGELLGSADLVSCGIATEPAGFVSFNDDEVAQTLRTGIISLTGVTGPTDVIRCNYTGVTTPLTNDLFTLNLVYASNAAHVRLEPTLTFRVVGCIPRRDP